jgi:hypothetical protein
MNNNKQQTAVEFIEYQVLHKRITDYFLLREMIKQAKELEKQQIMDAFGVGCHHESKRLVGYQDIAEQYYNETFNNKP